ncbi:MAG: hypothetical protein KGJ77_07715 [Acidobacteriota bacterium]|nr:hypothetical protein [Acidobacteriota bacterium]
MSPARPTRRRRPPGRPEKGASAARARARRAKGGVRRRQSRRGGPRLLQLGSWRRPRPVMVVGVAFAGVVLVTSMPVSALLTQHHQLATTSAALAQAQSADASLAAEAKALADAGTVGRLARSDYGLVPSGQKAYVILPPAGASNAEVAGSGHVPLEGAPVEPGSSQSQQLLGLGGSASPNPARAASRPASPPRHGAAGGFWARVGRTLEFWR